MKPEALQRFLGKFLEVGQQGAIIDQDDMDGLVAQQSRSYGELYDIQDGVRASADHPHHPVSELKSALTSGWIGMREIARRIESADKLT